MHKGERRRLVQQEFAEVDLGDERRSRRAVAIAERLAANPEASLPDAMGDRSATEALYRHLSNEKVSIDGLLAPHIARTVKRVEHAGLAFAVADTTEFEFGGEKPRDGLGPLNTRKHGFLTHLTLAISANGAREPLGALTVEAWARKEIKHTRRRKQWRFRQDETRESLRWGRAMKRATEEVPRAELIHVADRDSDIYEVLAQLLQDGQRFILRAAQNRKLVPMDSRDADRLFEAAQTSPTKYRVDVPVTARGDGVNRPAPLKKKYPKRGSRIATVSVASRAVTLKRSKALHASAEYPESLDINLVHLLELMPPPGQPPLEWLLLTSEPIDTPEELGFVIEGYKTRWMVEEFFKAVKTGCGFESKQLESFRSLTNMLAFVVVVAYALLLARTHAKRTDPATEVLTEQQVQVLRACTRRPLPNPLTARDALLAVAALGGHLKNNGDPGWRVLSKGWRKLLDYERGYAIAVAQRSDQS